MNAAFGLVRRHERACATVFGLLVVAPALLASLFAVTSTWFPTGDWATIEVRTHDVGTSATPLVGPYSRYGWNHPGPLLYYLLSPLYRVTQMAPWSLLVSAGLLNAAAIAGALAFAWRRGRWTLLLLVGLGLALVAESLDPKLLRDPWNAWLTVLPLATLMMSAWAATLGSRVGLIVAGLSASFLMQVHVGLVPLGVALLACAVAGALHSHLDRRSFAIAAALTGLCWVPVAMDQLFGDANLTGLVRYFSQGGEPLGFSTAAGVVALQLGGLAPWMGGAEPAAAAGGVEPQALSRLILPLLAFACAVYVSARRRAFDVLRLQGVVFVAAAVGFAGVARISGEPYEYLIRWWWIIAMLWWVSIIWALWEGLARHRFAGAGRFAAIGVAACALGVVLFTSSHTPDAPVPVPDLQREMNAIVDPTLASVGNQTVEVQGIGSAAGWLMDGLSARLIANGVQIAVEDGQSHKFGKERTTSRIEETARLFVVTGDDIALYRQRTDLSEVATWEAEGPADPKSGGPVSVFLEGQAG